MQAMDSMSEGASSHRVRACVLDLRSDAPTTCGATRSFDQSSPSAAPPLPSPIRQPHSRSATPGCCTSPRPEGNQAASSPLLSLGQDCLSRCISWLPDPAAAIAACKTLARATSSDDFATSWFVAGSALAAGCEGTRAVTWRQLRGKGAAERVKWLVACRRRERQERLTDAHARLCARAGGMSAAWDPRGQEVEREQEEEDALLMLQSHPCAALMLLGGPYAQHLLLPLAARCGDLLLAREIIASNDFPLRPMLLEGDPTTKHYVLVTAARAAMRSGQVKTAAWLVERVLWRVEEADIDRTDPACHHDPFGLLRFCCRYGTGSCITEIPALRRAAGVAVGGGAPAWLLRTLSAGVAGRVDAEGEGAARALVQALPQSARVGAVWLMLPFGCRGGHAPMQELMMRLADQYGLMSCLPGQMAQSTAAVREVLSAALNCQPPISDDALVQFIRAALHTVLNQPLIEAGQGDSVETAEELWVAVRRRGLQAQVTARLQLPASVPARVWLERRRLEGSGGAAGTVFGGARASSAPGGGADGEKQLPALQRWLHALLAGSGSTDGAAKPPKDPPLTHILECLEGVHGAAALEAAKQMLTNAVGDFGGARGAPGGSSASGKGGTWLTLRSHDALPSGSSVADAAALGQAIVAAAEGDTRRIEQLQQQSKADQRRARGDWWEARGEDWEIEAWHGGGAGGGGGGQRAQGLAAASYPMSRQTDGRQGRQGRWSSDAPPASPSPSPASFPPSLPSLSDVGYDKMLVSAAKHGRAAVLRQLLPPLLQSAGVGKLQSRGALLMGVALQRRQRDIVRLLVQYGLAAHASEGFRLLLARPPAWGNQQLMQGAGAAAAMGGVLGNGAGSHKQRGVGVLSRGDTGTGCCAPVAVGGAPGGVAARQKQLGAGLLSSAQGGTDAGGSCCTAEEVERREVEEDASVAFELLSSAHEGGRDERLLHNWLMAVCTQPEGSTWLCGRRCVALLRRVVRCNAGMALPVGARVAAPRALLQRGVLPMADMELLEAVFEWLEVAELVAE